MKHQTKWGDQWLGTLKPLLKAHWDWWERGQTGDGRLVIRDLNCRGANIRSLEGARAERCDFSGAGMNLLERVELVDCTFDDAKLMHSNWAFARIEGGRIRGAFMFLAHLDDASVIGGDWLGTDLERSFWPRASVTDVSFRSSRFVDTVMEGARFTDCEFMYANFGRSELLGDFARAPGTRFVNCDFRGANLEGFRLGNTVFENCKFHGMTGKPDLDGPCTLIAPDFSSEGNGATDSSGVPGYREPADVLRVWREYDAARIHHWSTGGDVIKYEPERFYPERRGS